MTNQTQPPGLTTEEAQKRLEQYGYNELIPEERENFFFKMLSILREPMFALLICAAVVYFFLGEPKDGLIMLVFVFGMIGIDVIQEWKTDRTLRALRDLSAPRASVLREGREIIIPSRELVPGDILLITEGVKIPADGRVIKASDLCVNESSLTGEPEGVWKSAAAGEAEEHWRRDRCYAGTLVIQGSGYVRVEETGSRTEYGKIGGSVAQAPDIPTPLQKQNAKLVRTCAWIAGGLFLLVCVITYFNLGDQFFRDRITGSILSGITLAMAMIPEEFPVILIVFLSMGAWRLARQNALVRRLPCVETLGAVSVLCVDKTGTITKNQMEVREVWPGTQGADRLLEIMGMACETEAYDPMEQAILARCREGGFTEEILFAGELVREYAFTNEAKMMGHVWSRAEGIVLAAKGSPEKLLPLCELEEYQRREIEAKLTAFSQQGLRVIGVGEMEFSSQEEIPQSLQECRLIFRGLIGLADPPRESVAGDIRRCAEAGVRVVMITGDNGITAQSIARQVGMEGCDRIITGDQVEVMTEEALREAVKEASIFSRVVPEHKMRIVKALKANGEVVAMTGDGVNDAPALKYADIGIAMGKRGCEVSREAADLVLMDDNFSTIVHTIRDGRRIYDNIKKAVGYVFTIHIPIAFASLLAPLLQIPAANLLLLPLHVVLLELIIDPTCSVVLERQPAERTVMSRPPRGREEGILSGGVLLKSLAQGLALFAASFFGYYKELMLTGNGAAARSVGLTVLMIANLFLVQVNSSETDPFWVSGARMAKDKVMWLVNLLTVAGLLAILYTPLNGILKLAPLGIGALAAAAGIGIAAVVWYELVKFVKRRKSKRKERFAEQKNRSL